MNLCVALGADIVIKALRCAIRCSYGRNKGASWRETQEMGVLVLIRYVSTVTLRGHSILAKRPGNSMVPVDDQNLLFHKDLWDGLTVCCGILSKLN